MRKLLIASLFLLMGQITPAMAQSESCPHCGHAFFRVLGYENGAYVDAPYVGFQDWVYVITTPANCGLPDGKIYEGGIYGVPFGAILGMVHHLRTPPSSELNKDWAIGAIGGLRVFDLNKFQQGIMPDGSPKWGSMNFLTEFTAIAPAWVSVDYSCLIGAKGNVNCSKCRKSFYVDKQFEHNARNLFGFQPIGIAGFAVDTRNTTGVADVNEAIITAQADKWLPIYAISDPPLEDIELPKNCSWGINSVPGWVVTVVVSDPPGPTTLYRTSVAYPRSGYEVDISTPRKYTFTAKCGTMTRQFTLTVVP